MKNNIYVTSDLHLGHQKAIEWRRFRSINEMNTILINKLLTTVKFEDTIYHLGDFAFGIAKETYKLRLNTIYVRGNHDPQSISNIKNLIITWRGKDIEMVHDPKDASGKIEIVLHGHIHKTGNRTFIEGSKQLKEFIHEKDGIYYYNVNCEFHKYKPKLINDIIGEIKLVRKNESKR